MVRVRAHTRKTKRGMTTVREHTRKHKGKTRERIRPRPSPPPSKKIWKRTDFRIFNGKKFHVWANHDPVSKTWAIGITRHLHRKRFHTRMIKVKGGYVIFEHKITH